MEPWERDMSDEIRVGDRFLTEIEITSKAPGRIDTWFGVVVGFPLNTRQLFTSSELLSGKRLPRPLAVGDRVTIKERWTGVQQWRVAAIDDGMAAVVGLPPDEIAHNWFPLSDLTPAPDKEA